MSPPLRGLSNQTAEGLFFSPRRSFAYSDGSSANWRKFSLIKLRARAKVVNGQT